MSEEYTIFDRRRLRRRRAAAAANMPEAGFLHREVRQRLLERLEDINREFGTALAIGWDAPNDEPVPAKEVVFADLAETRLPAEDALAVAADEEFLPFAESSFDLLLGNLTLHWVNDLPGCLIQSNYALKPDGLFLAAMLGGETLYELRSCLLDAELEISGGASPRISPMAELRDLGGLLQRAGFAMPVVDTDRLTVTYGDPLALMRDLKAMGETNMLLERQRRFTRRGIFLRAAELYAERFARSDGRLPASFEILFLTGWAPGPGQPRPKRPGSATTRLAEALGSEEISVPGVR